MNPAIFAQPLYDKNVMGVGMIQASELGSLLGARNDLLRLLHVARARDTGEERGESLVLQTALASNSTLLSSLQ